MPFVFDPAAIIASQGPRTLGDDDSESRNLSKSHHCDRLSFPLNTSTVDSESLEFRAATFEISHDCLHSELGSMRILLREIQYAEWPYRQFPYVPDCLLVMCGFALAHALVVDDNPIYKIVWRTTQNAALSLGSNRLRLTLLVGLGFSGMWSFCRACILGTIIWCRFSLNALIKKFEADQLDKRDFKALDGFQWRMLWLVTTQL
ncbi:uncharacterized protein Bfra_006129 [Botrytis fragariae]|uniref:Uncharacterized protein n=1 Tax=Botrytis fragariae TaxID=1964551 RepID=A0A8H6ASF9_9HELO|nr:uncharacterized protein Bfra_006129 [Botrytis fragariae]KAF5872766.1 hypothetical protein Bfra_006129 [Botrytis fragariae]